MKKHLAVLTCLLCVIILAMPIPALAANASLDCEVTVEHIDKESGSLAGATFRLYCVAKGNTEDYKVTGNFTGVQEEMKKVHWNSAAVDVTDFTEVLAAHIKEKKPSPVKTGTVGKDGRLTFHSLQAGLYLIQADPFSMDDWTYTTQDILVWIPYTDPYGNLIKSAVCETKHEKTPDEFNGDIPDSHDPNENEGDDASSLGSSEPHSESSPSSPDEDISFGTPTDVPPTENPDAPTTGDETLIGIYLGLLFASAVLFVVVLAYYRKTRRK